MGCLQFAYNNNQCNNEYMIQNTELFKTDYIINKITSDVCINGYLYFNPRNENLSYIGSRIHLLWDDNNWIFCFETLNYTNANGLTSELIWFWDGLDVNETFKELKINYAAKLIDVSIRRISENDNVSSFSLTDTVTATLGGDTITLPLLTQIYDHLHKRCPDYKRIDRMFPSDIYRYLFDFHSDKMFLTNDSIKALLDTNLKIQSTISEWKYDEFNCDFVDEGILPNVSKPIIQIVGIIEAKSDKKYRQNFVANNDWKYWWMY